MKLNEKIGFVVLALIMLAATTSGQLRHTGTREASSNVIIPQSRRISFAPERQNAIEIMKVNVLADILHSAATTTVEIELRNNTNQRQEAELIFPVPDGAVAKGFAYDGPGGEITAEVLAKEEARRIYEQLVAKIRDPALVEFIGYNLIRSSVFPIEAHSTQKVRLTYENLLEVNGNRIDYSLVRTESLSYEVPWDIKINIKANAPISTVYSSSHKLTMDRKNEKEVSVKIEEQSQKEPGPFRLSYLLKENDVTASMFAYPQEKVGGGYFLLLAGLNPGDLNSEKPTIQRELTIVIDRSGSMRNEKIEQVKEAALQIIAGLNEGEAFNVLTYSNSVDWFSAGPVLKNSQTEEAAKKYIESITANGGTNLHEALQAALAQKPANSDMLPIVLFMTDGLPTVGQTSEIVIRELAEKSNPYKRRVFTVGVGVDLNAPLLDKIAEASRAKAEYILPGEDVEAKIGKVFDRLTGPILTDVKLEVLDKDGKPAVGRCRDILPREISDFFEGDQLVLLGQYIGTKPIVFQLTGNYKGEQRTFRFEFNFDDASEKNGFVPRLWASRKIAELIDNVRQLGAEPGSSANDPKTKELIDEIVKLSTEFGILTEYTAFLAREGTDFENPAEVSRYTGRMLEDRAVSVREGKGAVSQSINLGMQKSQSQLNARNYYFDAKMEQVAVTNVQQINDRAYYYRGNRWVDSRLLKDEATIKPNRIIKIGTPEFIELVSKLAASNRQGSIALGGNVLLVVDGEPVLVKVTDIN
ncbi:MAG: VIT and VWA domain-containing protein [Phycisphaerae bacterium]